MKGLSVSTVLTALRRCASSGHRRFTINIGSTSKKIGVYSVIVSLVTCGSLLWIEVETIRDKLSLFTKFNVIDLEKTTNPYIYITDRELDLDAKTHDIKKKYLDPEKINKESWFPWLQSHSQDPWTLLKLTKSCDRKTRWLGVKAIADMVEWEDYKCRYISQACDGRTLVGLARSEDASSRFFLPPGPLQPLKRSSLVELKSLLQNLPLDNVDQCTEYITTEALDKGQTIGQKSAAWGMNNTSFTSSQMAQVLPDEMVQLYYLEALERHSQNIKQCQHIVDREGLFILFHMVKEQTNNTSPHRVRLVARIIANLSRCPCLHAEIIRLGWVPVLSRWMSGHGDLELSQLAIQALHNLDRDFTSDLCEDGVYVIHPVHRKRDIPQCDVVFVHGIMGGPFKTWRQKDKPGDPRHKKDSTQSMCWPKDWLATDCPNIRILTVEFDTHLSEWYIRCPHDKDSRTVEMRGQSLLEKLHSAGVGSRPIVWVGHSMGGLLIKQMLSVSQTDAKYSQVAAQTRGVVFYSVPHRGSPMADTFNHAWYILYPSVEVQQLSEDSKHLKSLHENFLSYTKSNNIECLSFGETAKTSFGKKLPQMQLVPPQSSDPGVGEFHLVDANHINICKPADPTSHLYTLPLGLIRHVILESHVGKLLNAGIAFEEANS